ncbi:hypothetical protein [Nocardia sp. NPDC051570]|uniref:CdiA C-terminal domain-containing protein n=1 Tax=Nocardia sp. NPDC051570 TaxID=3364324 RepID=UPI0037B75B8E
MTAPTVPLIVCRGDEYHSAGEVFGQMATDTLTTHSGLVTVLTNYAGMAGDDSVGAQWASSYNEAAQLAVSTSSKLTTSCGQVRDIILVSAYNHQVAETTAHLKDSPPPPPPQLLPDPCPPETVPSAAGNGIPEPFGWSIIKDAVGMAWPDGHQDQLNAAAAAWYTTAGDYRTIAGQTPQAVELLRNQQSPEIDVAVQTCTDRQADLTALADVCQTLGDACGNYAHHLDEAHSQILHELRELAIETAAGEAAFAILIPFTGSLSEWIGNSALAARIATKARRIATIIAELAAKAAKIVTDAIKPLVERIKPLWERIRKWVAEARTKLSRADKGEKGPSGKPPVKRGNIDESAKQFSPEERKIADLLAEEGKEVKAVKESNAQRTPDAEVDGHPTEFKTMSPGATNTNVRNALNSAKGQADTAIIDGRGSGLTQDEAQRGVNRFLGANPAGRMTSIRIVGDGWEIRWP